MKPKYYTIAILLMAVFAFSNSMAASTITAQPNAAYCAGDTITITFDADVVSPPTADDFQVELSDAAGNFTGFATGAVLSQASDASNRKLGVRIPAGAATSTAYKVRLTQTNAAAVVSDTFTINALPAITVILTDPSICEGETIGFNATTAGGTPAYTWAWTGPAGFSANTEDATRINAASNMEGDYRVIVTDSKGCKDTGVVNTGIIHTKPAISANTTTPTLCQGQTINLTSSPAGGQTPYVFAWSGPAGYSASTEDPSRANATTAMSGTYTVILTDDEGCKDTATISVTVNAKPVITAATTTPSVCAGATISLTSAPGGGATPYVFTWTGPSSFSSGQEDPNRNNATTAMSGIYTVIVTDDNGCKDTASTSTITVNAKPAVTASVLSAAVCVGKPITLSSTPSGGSAPYDFLWSGPASYSSTQEDPVRPNATLAMAGVYTVEITDDKGCKDTASTAAVVVNPLPTVTAGTTTPSLCVGQTISLTATGSGGTGNLDYDWTGPLAYSSNSQNPNILTAILGMAGVYTVIVTDTKGCTDTASTNSITVNSLLTPTITINAPQPNDTICLGATLTVTATATNGNTFHWKDGNTIISTNDTLITNTLTAGLHTIKSTLIASGGCTSQDSVTSNQYLVYVHPQPVSPALSYTPTADTLCEGASVAITATSGTGGFNTTDKFEYKLDNGAWQNYTTAINAPGANDSLVIRAYRATTGNGCNQPAANTHTFILRNDPSVSIQPVNSVCEGTVVNLTTQQSGGAGAVTYQWERSTTGTNGPYAAVNGTNVNYTVPANEDAGDYWYRVVMKATGNGCTNDTGKINVVISALPPVPTIDAQWDTVCKGTQHVWVGVTSGSASNYAWSATNAAIKTFGNAPNAYASFANSGPATITLQISNGSCSNSATRNIFVSNQTAPSPSAIQRFGNNTLICLNTTSESYQWGFDSLPTYASVTLAGETFQEYTSTGLDFQKKAYWVVTKEGSCYTKSYYNQFSGVDDVEQLYFTMYPNPADNIVIIQGNKYFNQVEVTDILGKRIISNRYAQPVATETLDFSLFTPGIYLVSISTDFVKPVTGKIIIK